MCGLFPVKVTKQTFDITKRFSLMTGISNFHERSDWF